MSNIQNVGTRFKEVHLERKVRSVTIDAWKHLTVRFSHRLPVSDWVPDRFQLSSSSGESIPIKAVYPFKHRGDRCAVYSLEVDQPFDHPEQTYTLDVEGLGKHPARADYILKDADHFYDANAALGATYSAESTTFAVFAPGATDAVVVISDAAKGRRGTVEHAMVPAGKGIWTVPVEGDLAGKFYAFKISGPGLDAKREVIDPYARCTQARFPRALIVDLPLTDPPGFREHLFAGPQSAADAIVYEMHVRDFTISADSGVTSKGKYRGITERDTHLASGPSIRTGLAHLVEMGVTHVQLMPVQDFDNDESTSDAYDWGYMPLHFNSPDGWYASDASGFARIVELKSAIMALHKQGLGVILDVVYNHTAKGASFEKLVPGYYFRRTPGGQLSNGSGCGNEFASEAPMARKFLIDSVKLWASQYKIDGFRFDLMGLTDFETMQCIREELLKINPRILIFGEPWTAGSTPLSPTTDKAVIRGSGIGAFNDHFRDAIKGERDGGDGGFMQTGANVDGVVKGLMGGIHDWSLHPTDSVNYFESHDNLTCWDKLEQTVSDAPVEQREQMMRFATLILLTSQGMVFLHSGQEMCRSKKGNHNSYDAPDEINQIDWSRKVAHANVFEYTRGLIALRKAHPVFRLRTREEVERRVHFDTPPNGRCIVYRLDGSDLGAETARSMLVLLNGAMEDTRFVLPDADWAVLADDRRSGIGSLEVKRGDVMLPAHSGMVLAAH
ncbi:MAG: type I pullulanase [Planctomycetes bacterium]|nr:type I pullulanase [Planctomycetota bacterium]